MSASSGEFIWVADTLADAYNLVETALERKKACRNSDEFLIWYIKKHLLGSGESTDLNDFSEFKGSPSVSTLLRKRREIQNDEGRFPPTKPLVARDRGIMEDVILQHYGDDQEILKKFLESEFFETDEVVVCG